MTRHAITLATIALIAAVAWQQLVIADMQSAMARTEHRYWNQQTAIAGFEGAITGMTAFQGKQQKLLKTALAESLIRIEELETTLDSKQQLVESLQRGRMLRVTAYSAEPEQTDDTPNITASNNPVRRGIVAVSRDLFESGWTFGRRVFVEGLGVFTIDDLMHKRKREQIDIFMHDTDQALRFGRQEMNVHLLGEDGSA
jgi:3D (Asp-Asp-Asp) domain-containing protein